MIELELLEAILARLGNVAMLLAIIGMMIK